MGHPFPCHQEAPGHLGVLADQGGPWLHLDLDHPGRSSHRHGETKRCWQGVGLTVSTTHALHPWATSTLASAVPEEFNCSFQLGKLKVSSWPIYAIWVWFLSQDCGQCLPVRFNLLKPLPSDCLHGIYQPNSTQRNPGPQHAGREHAHTATAQCTTPENHTEKVSALNLILYIQPRSHMNIPSRSHPAALGGREHAVSLWLCGFGGCHSQGERPVGLQAGYQLQAPHQPPQPSPGAVARPIHAAAQWEMLMERPPRKSFRDIWESHHRGGQRAVFNMQSTLKSGTSVGFFRSP